MSERLTHTECDQCGWLGPLADTKAHPIRPMNDDTLCPECGCECTGWITEAEYLAKMAEYGEEEAAPTQPKENEG